jgi:hypothetical protein
MNLVKRVSFSKSSQLRKMSTPGSRLPSSDETNLFTRMVLPLLTRKVTEPAPRSSDGDVYDRDDTRNARRNCGGVNCMALNAQQRNFDRSDMESGLPWNEQINSRLNEVKGGNGAQAVPVLRTGQSGGNVVPQRSARLTS